MNLLWNKSIVSKTQATTTEDLDVTTVLYCAIDNMCLLRRDLIKGKCPRCDGSVVDVTDSPLGKSWLAIVAPRAKKKKPKPNGVTGFLPLSLVPIAPQGDIAAMIILGLIGIFLIVILVSMFRKKE